jgi:hypothetical protein
MAIEGALSFDHGIAAAAQAARSSSRPARAPSRPKLYVAASEGTALSTDLDALPQVEAVEVEEDARAWERAPRGIAFGVLLCLPFWAAVVAWALW